jgi:hypothetical protein
MALAYKKLKRKNKSIAVTALGYILTSIYCHAMLFILINYENKAADSWSHIRIIQEPQEAEHQKSNGAADEGPVDTNPGQIFTDFAFNEVVELLFIEAHEYLTDGYTDQRMFILQDDCTGPPYLVIEPLVDFRILIAIIDIPQELPFHDVHYLFFAFQAGLENTQHRLGRHRRARILRAANRRNDSANPVPYR